MSWAGWKIQQYNQGEKADLRREASTLAEELI